MTEERLKTIQKSAISNVLNTAAYSARYKQAIQIAIIPLLSAAEKEDIRACRLNFLVVDKLVALGKSCYNTTDRTDESAYYIAMAIATIIKEYDWGTGYLTVMGLTDLCNRIQKLV